MNGNKIIRALAVLVCALMLIQCTALGVFAYEISPEAVVYVKPEVVEAQANQIGKNYVYVDIETTDSDNDQTVMVYLTDAYGNLVTLAYAPISENATQAKLGVPDSAPTATYKIIVALNKAADVYKSEIYYIGVGDVDGLFEAINSEDEAAVAEKLQAHYEALSVIESTKDEKLTGDSYEALSDDAKAAFATLIANGVNGAYSNGKGEYNAENSEGFVKEAYVVAAYNEGGFSDEELAKLIYSFSATIGFDAEDENLYGKIENTDTLMKVAKTIDKTVENAEELATVLETAAAIQIVNETHWLNLVNVVNANNELFNVSESQIETLLLKSSLRKKFCEEFKGTYYSVEEIQKAWKTAYKTVTAETGGSSTTTEKKTTVTTNVVYTQLSNTENNYDPNVEILDYYTDVANTSYEWACDEILSLTKAGIVSGYGDKTFAPGNSLTRAEFIKMVVNVFGLADLTATSTFTDVDQNAWYYVYVASAEKCGLTTGYGDGTFGVNDKLTRQDAITLVYRAAKIKGISVDYFTKSASNLTDKDSIAPYALEAVEALYNTGVYLDASDPTSVNVFEPTRNATRAYISVILNQVYTYMN